VLVNKKLAKFSNDDQESDFEKNGNQTAIALSSSDPRE